MFSGLCKEKLGQRHGLDILAVFVNAHIAGCDLVDEHKL